LMLILIAFTILVWASFGSGWGVGAAVVSALVYGAYNWYV